ncbi:MAG TPA: class I SAM-dependent methyltransferase, partial [Actinomycetota bacterium]
MPPSAGDYVESNRSHWDRAAAEFAEPGRRAWGLDEPLWGIFRVPESQLGILPGEVAGRDVVELGCGTAYVSAWLARRGARPAGVDLSAGQLATASRLQREFGLPFPLVQADAE